MLRQFPQEGISTRIEEALNPPNLGMIFLIRATLIAGREAHFHLGIDTAGERWIGVQIINAAAHFKEIKRITREFFCANARGEWAVIGIRAMQREPRRYRGAWIFVFQMQ